MLFRGIRGAITVDENTREAILGATRELLAEIISRNGVRTEDVASAFFSMTNDLDAEYPPHAARDHFGWTNAALMCFNDMHIPGSLRQCLRVTVHVNSELSQADIQHVFLRGATVLRPDLT